jgi:hypothetical protein
MLEKIQKSLIELVLESIREDRRGTTSVPTTIVNGVINSFVAVEDPKQRIPGDPSNHLTVSYHRIFATPLIIFPTKSQVPLKSELLLSVL